ncbi:MAG: peptidylprolyl isomerase [Puniceicoccaceae bacterium]
MKHTAKTIANPSVPHTGKFLPQLVKRAKTGSFLLLSCLLSAPPASAETAARIGGRQIDLEELEALLPDLSMDEKLAFAANPETFNQHVRSLLIQEIVHDAAVANEWDQNPKARAAVERARRSAIVESYLRAVAEVPESFPSEEQLEAFYEANRSSFTASKQYELSQIFLSAAGADDTGSLRQRAEEIHQAIARGEMEFAEAAEKYSDEESTSENGGRIGWIAEDNLQPDLRPAVAALSPGEMTEVVERPDGFHIVRLEQVSEAFTVPFEDARGRLAAQMRARRAQANREAFLDRLIRENPVALNEIVIEKLLKEQTER